MSVKEYSGSCHCGDIKFTVKAPEIKEVTYCDCSICSRNAALWIFPEKAEDVVITEGESKLKPYLFGKKQMAHCFCPSCGTTILAKKDGKPAAINVRPIEEVDLDSLKIKDYPGSEVPPSYQPPEPVKSDLVEEEGYEIHNGNCHCGAVKYQVKTKPVYEVEAISCNCSICRRGGEFRIFTSKGNIRVEGEENVTDYMFGKHFVKHKFCSKCGVSVYTYVVPEAVDLCAANVRTMLGVDITKLKVKKVDGKSVEAPDAEAAQKAAEGVIGET